MTIGTKPNCLALVFSLAALGSALSGCDSDSPFDQAGSDLDTDSDTDSDADGDCGGEECGENAHCEDDECVCDYETAGDPYESCTYEEYVHHCGDDHLDTDRVILKARQEKKEKQRVEKERKEKTRKKPRSPDSIRKAERKRALEREEKLLARVEEVETRLAEIDALFCRPAYFERAPVDEVKALEKERSSLEERLADLMEKWEKTDIPSQ